MVDRGIGVNLSLASRGQFVHKQFREFLDGILVVVSCFVLTKNRFPRCIDA